MKDKERYDKMKILLNEEFLIRLSELGRLYGWSGDYIEVRGFIAELHMIIDLEVPELDPYEINYD